MAKILAEEVDGEYRTGIVLSLSNHEAQLIADLTGRGCINFSKVGKIGSEIYETLHYGGYAGRERTTFKFHSATNDFQYLEEYDDRFLQPIIIKASVPETVTIPTKLHGKTPTRKIRSDKGKRRK